MTLGSLNSAIGKDMREREHQKVMKQFNYETDSVLGKVATAVGTVTLMANLAESFKALVKVPHSLLQVCMFLMENMFLHFTLQRTDYILMDL